MPPPFDLFLSHNSEDKPRVRELADALMGRGVRAWLDERELPPGRPFQDGIEEVVRSAKAAAVLIGEAGFGPWQRAEMYTLISQFVNRALPVIPVLLPGAPAKPELPPFLAELTYVDARGGLTDSVLDRMVWGVHGVRPDNPGPVAQAPAPTRMEPTAHVVVPGRTLLIDGVPYCYVPAGRPLVGSDDGYQHERPEHRIRVSSFLMAAIPVTNLLFDRFVQATGYVTDAEVIRSGYVRRVLEWEAEEGADWRHPQGQETGLRGKASHPAVQLSWTDARHYCEWLSSRSALEVTLPSEGQWEYAARGLAGNTWSFGNRFAAGKANIEGNDTTAVGAYPPNEHGIFDLCGNTFEWCRDWYAPRWEEAGRRLGREATEDPTGPGAGRERILRGGSWIDTAHHCRACNRFWAPPDMTSANWGFRCCITIDDAFIDLLRKLPEWGLTVEETLVGKG